MDFKEAIEKLKSGYKIRLKQWDVFDYIKSITLPTKDEKEIRYFFPQEINFIYPPSIVFSDDWQVVGEDESKLLSFTDAIEKVFNKNCKIKLKTWYSDTWVELSEPTNELRLRTMDNKPFYFEVDMMKSNDWELLGD